MKIVKFVCASLLLSSALFDIANSLSCAPKCNKSKCPKLNCPGSEVPGLCLCCNRCAKQEGEGCGGDFTLSGVCDEGLTCGRKEPRISSPGIMVFVPPNVPGNCIKEYNSCQEACASLSAKTNDPIGFSKRGRSALLKPSYAVEAFWAYCDCPRRDRAWTVAQRRKFDSTNFDRMLAGYVKGFGYSTSDFWLGLGNMHGMTKNMPHEMKVIIKYKQSSVNKEIMFDEFRVGNNTTSYQLKVTPVSEASSRYFASVHDDMPFSAKDQDNDLWLHGECAKMYGGGWWYNKCTEHNLNGRFYMNHPHIFVPAKSRDGPDKISWEPCKGEVEAAEIWIRPKYYVPYY